MSLLHGKGGTECLVVADYPGQSRQQVQVTIQNGQVITLNVSPANAIGSLTIQGGAANTGLIISDGFILNVTGLVQLIRLPLAQLWQTVLQ
jgi:hypothetical protein